MTYILENNEAINLVKFKLEAIQDAIDSILDMWKVPKIEDFLESTASGNLDEAVFSRLIFLFTSLFSLSFLS